MSQLFRIIRLALNLWLFSVLIFWIISLAYLNNGYSIRFKDFVHSGFITFIVLIPSTGLVFIVLLALSYLTKKPSITGAFLLIVFTYPIPVIFIFYLDKFRNPEMMYHIIIGLLMSIVFLLPSLKHIIRNSEPFKFNLV